MEKRQPKRRFKDFQSRGDWEEIKLGEILKAEAFGGYLKNPELNGKYAVIQQGNDPIIGYANGSPYREYEKVVLFGDHTLSLYKPKSPFFIATDGVKLLTGIRKINGNFLLYMLYKNKPKNEGYKRYYSILKDKYVYYLNNIEEQKKIGDFFQRLDRLIDLNRSRLDKLRKTKEAYLVELFPREGESYPRRRFPGFTGPWEEKKFDKVFIYISNNSFSRAYLSNYNGLIKNIHYGDILIKFGEVLDVKNDYIPYIWDDFIAQKLEHTTLKNGDIIIADAAEDETVGKSTEIMNITNEKVVAGLHTIACRPIIDFKCRYLGYFMNSPSYHDQLIRLIQGTKVSSISKNSIKETNILYPSLEEQKKIGDFFQSLDGLIAKEEERLDKLENLKKAYLNELFV